MTKVICDICGKEIDKRAIHLHMRIHEKEKGGEVEGEKVYDYHVLFPDLTCVVREGSDVYATPVLAFHISREGGWMIICDKNGNLVRSDNVHGECYICSGKKEAQKLLKMLRKSEKVRGGMFTKIKEKLRSRKTERGRKEEEKSELSEERVVELISALKEFAKTKKEDEEDEF